MCVIIVYESSFFNLLRDDTSPQIGVCPPARSLIHSFKYTVGVYLTNALQIDIILRTAGQINPNPDAPFPSSTTTLQVDAHETNYNTNKQNKTKRDGYRDD